MNLLPLFASMYSSSIPPAASCEKTGIASSFLLSPSKFSNCSPAGAETSSPVPTFVIGSGATLSLISSKDLTSVSDKSERL